MDSYVVDLTRRERDVIAYALAYYAKGLDESGEDEGYTGPLETAPEVRALEQKLRRLM